jgi:molecular chaperone GrpE
MSSRERHDQASAFLEELEDGLDGEVILVSDESDEEAPHQAGHDDDIVSVGGTVASDDERFKRLQSDFENLEKRSDREREGYTHRATVGLVTRLLPVLDNFERALSVGSEPTDGEAMRDGVVLIFRQLADELRREGLEAIDALGQSFDPEIHEAVETDTASGKPSNFVVDEFQRGYRLKGDLLRPALVKVSIDAMDNFDNDGWNED